MSICKDIIGVVFEAAALGLIFVALLFAGRWMSARRPVSKELTGAAQAVATKTEPKPPPSEAPTLPAQATAPRGLAAPLPQTPAAPQIPARAQALPTPPRQLPSAISRPAVPIDRPTPPPQALATTLPVEYRPEAPRTAAARPTAPAPVQLPQFLPQAIKTTQGAATETESTDLDEDKRFVPAPVSDEPEGTPVGDGAASSRMFSLTPRDYPLGFTGPSSVLPRAVQTDEHFVPVEDRWRIGFPEWDRYGKGHPRLDDYPYVKGHWWDPYNQNVLKGDYPIFGQHTFLDITASSRSLFEPRQVPTATTAFESTVNPDSERFFGNPNQFFFAQFFSLSFDLFHGDAAFKPVDWRIKVTPVFNINTLSVSELAVVGPDVRDGVTRYRTFATLQEWFVETKLADLGPDYDFVSVRAGSQPFVSDFRGFIFADVNRGIRLFGNRNSNREQFNLAVFSQLEKDTNSMLNSFHERHQQVAIANYFIQDFIFPGYTTQFSVHYNHDEPTFKFDNNGFLVRPDPVGVFQPHRLDVAYLGWTGDGHINRLNINHALYWALGHDSLNPLSNSEQDISAQMAALELSYDRDWVRFRGSVFWASGDGDINNDRATGFDSILDNPNFAGGEFSYWQRQTIRLFGVNLVQRQSLVPDLRSSKIQGQSNFVNPGLLLLNTGVDFEVTPRLRLINNINFLWFDDTNTLRQFVFQDKIDRFIGTDLSVGCEYRPLLNNNVLLVFGASTLIPGTGLKDLFNDLNQEAHPLFAAFLDVVLTY